MLCRFNIVRAGTKVSSIVPSPSRQDPVIVGCSAILEGLTAIDLGLVQCL